MTGTHADTSGYPKEHPMQSPRLFLLTLGALSLGATNGPVTETSGREAPPPPLAPER
jgi:hypothetical protein